MGKGSGFNAPIEAIESTGQDVRGLADKAKGIAEASSNAEVSETAWGVVGIFVKSGYSDLLQQLNKHLTEIQEGLTSNADKLTESAQNYKQIDQETQGSLQQIMGKFTTGGDA